MTLYRIEQITKYTFRIYPRDSRHSVLFDVKSMILENNGNLWKVRKSLTSMSRPNPHWTPAVLEDGSDEPIKVITQPITPELRETLKKAMSTYLLEIITSE